MSQPLVFVVAGEPSADALGARLMHALRQRRHDDVDFAGVGGPLMVEAGLSSLFPMSELSVMGFAEIVPHLPRLIGRLKQTERAARRLAPDMVLTIDSPGFNLRLLRRLGSVSSTRVHYVGPQAWAWRPDRAKRFHQLMDHLLLLFPFEPEFFDRYGVTSSFVGHPVIEEASPGDGPVWRDRNGIAQDIPLICVLPGSRHGEVARHMPVIVRTLEHMAGSFPGMQAVMPTVPAVADHVRRAARECRVPVHVFTDRDERFDAFAACQLAIAASGTVALELALAQLPMITIYRVNALTGWLARRLIRVPHVNAINLILERDVVPELLQDACQPEQIAKAALAILRDPEEQERQQRAMAQATALLGRGATQSPSQRAAAVLDDLLGSDT